MAVMKPQPLMHFNTQLGPAFQAPHAQRAAHTPQLQGPSRSAPVATPDGFPVFLTATQAAHSLSDPTEWNLKWPDQNNPCSWSLFSNYTNTEDMTAREAQAFIGNVPSMCFGVSNEEFTD